MEPALTYFKLEPAAKESDRLTVEVGIARTCEFIQLDYRVRDPLQRVLLPQDDPQRGPELWQNTCFELFARLPGQNEYWEWNFSPDAQSNFFCFTAYRNREHLLEPSGNGIELQRFFHEGNDLRLSLRLGPPPGETLKWIWATMTPLELSPTLVLKYKDGSLGYWASRHPAPQPDFHHAGNFVISI